MATARALLPSRVSWHTSLIPCQLRTHPVHSFFNEAQHGKLTSHPGVSVTDSFLALECSNVLAIMATRATTNVFPKRKEYNILGAS